MKQMLISIFQSNRKFRLLLVIVAIVIVNSLVMFQAIILPRLSDKFYGRIVEANHYGNSSTLIALSQHMNYLFSLHSESLTEVRIQSNSTESIQDYLNIMRTLPGAKNVYCLLDGKKIITIDGVNINEAITDSLRNMRNLFKSYNRGALGHPKKFHNYIMNKIRFVNLYDGVDTLRLILSALDSTGNRFQLVPKKDFDTSMIKYLIITEIDEEWLRKEVPLHMEREFWDNEIFAMWSMADPSKNKEENGAGVLAFGDTLWWVGIKSIETEDEAKGALCEWEYSRHPWFHYRTLTELADDDNWLWKAGWEFRRHKANFWKIYAFTLLIALFLMSLLIIIRRQWLANQIALSHLAHSIKTPVSRIRLDTDSLLKEMVASPAEEREIITAIGNECGRLELAIQGAALSLEKGKRTPNLETCDLNQIFTDTTLAWRQNFDQVGIRLNIKGEGGQLNGQFDSEMTALMIDNLLDNALRHTDLNLSNINKETAVVSVQLSKVAGKAEIVVDDMGAGIPKSQRKNIFKRFKRAKGDAASGVSGLGLGLALVKEIVEAHKGNVFVTDNDAGGARFVVELPIS